MCNYVMMNLVSNYGLNHHRTNYLTKKTSTLLPSLGKKHGKLVGPAKMQEAPTCKPYYQSSISLYKHHSTWVLIYFPYLVA